MDNQLKVAIFTAADQCLLTGEAPHASRLLSLSPEASMESIAAILAEWWQQLPSRLHLRDETASSPDMPEAMRQVFTRVWQQAVQEASVELNAQVKRPDLEADVMQRERDDALKRSQGEIGELEQRYREQALKLDEAHEQYEALGAELQVLRHNLANETTQRKKEEQLRANAEQELAQLRRSYEENKRVFDQRVRDEQRHNLEALAKVDVDTRHYRNALEKLRDESGRREAEMTRELHELQGVLARRDVKIETLTTQVKSQDEALRGLKSRDAQQQREQTQISAQLLTETNKSKRYEEQLRQLEESLQKLNQKQVSNNSESARRESQLRSQLKQCEEELLKSQARAQGFEKRAGALEEEMRRLKQRV
ncbi:plasmid replication DNA-binding protein KfrA [Marinobacterium halophilum]|uniref:Plasmid replication DNA-binding protein KfrA n=1 Tax=Marinobacterium halophilum TaxID=267374 RepID=A0A2P8F0A1_9GAMM|nr:DNA-binding protein [Marinobacterium halophilum]PSL15137.1 plasmid replication DNA-binding protein KfrA [Marinobacterium halophilum]